MTRALLLITLVAGCGNNALSGNFDLGPDFSTAVDGAVAPDLGPRTPVTKVDILFMVDDSGSTAPYQAELRTRFPQIIKSLDDLAAAGHKASYHFGVVTSDLGAPGIVCGMNRGAKLQGVGAAASGCGGPVGANYIEYDQQTGVNNLPAGQDLATTFGCMSNVGDHGCGFEAPLEAVYRALHDPIAENAGFLRDDAILVVAFITNEDDCSADPTSDLFTANPAYGPLNSFRCTRYGIFCDGAMVAGVPASYATCTPATPAQGSKLTDLQKYLNFFTQKKAVGGVKNDPRNVILASIAAAPAPFTTSTANDTSICGAGTASCTVLNHSCVSPTDSTIFGDPAVRLNAVVSAATHATGSICGDDVQSTFDTIAMQIAAGL